MNTNNESTMEFTDTKSDHIKMTKNSFTIRSIYLRAMRFLDMFLYVRFIEAKILLSSGGAISKVIPASLETFKITTSEGVALYKINTSCIFREWDGVSRIYFRENIPDAISAKRPEDCICPTATQWYLSSQLWVIKQIESARGASIKKYTPLLVVAVGAFIMAKVMGLI